MQRRKDIVLTPAGPRRRNQVHAVAPGQVVRRTPEGSYVLVREGSSAGGGKSSSEEELVLTPGGLRPRSLVHRIEPEHVLDGTDGRYRMRGRAGRVLADFGVVPLRPAGRPLMPRNVFFPAPQAVPAFGSGWITYASWYADGQTGQSFHSSLVDMSVGDVLVGVMTLTAQSAQGFSYGCEFQGIANTSLPVQNIQQLTWCCETLEAYSITRCSDYPDTSKTAMRAIELRTGSTHPAVVWTVSNAVTDCGQHTLRFNDESIGHGEVDLWYRGGPFWTFGAGTIGPGETQEWWFGWGGTGVGPQLIQAEPLNPRHT